MKTSKCMQKIGQTRLMTMMGYAVGQSINSNTHHEMETVSTPNECQPVANERMSDEKIILIVIVVLLLAFAVVKVILNRKKESEQRRLDETLTSVEN